MGPLKLERTQDCRMKAVALLLLAIAGAQANFVSFLYDSEINSAVKAAQAVFHAEISLRSADSEAHAQVVREIQTEIGKQLQESLQNVTNKINNAVAQGKQISEDLLKKAAELGERMKEIGGNVWKGAQDILGHLSTKAEEAVNGLMAGLEGLWNSIKDIFGKRSLDHMFEEMQHEVVAKTVHAVMSKRFIGDLWQGIKDTFSSIINGIGSGLNAFGQWIGDLVKKGVEAAQPHIDNIKQLAQETLDHLSNATQQVIDQAIEFFRPYHEDLGKLWDQLVQAGKDIHAGIISKQEE